MVVEVLCIVYGFTCSLHFVVFFFGVTNARLTDRAGEDEERRGGLILEL